MDKDKTPSYLDIRETARKGKGYAYRILTALSAIFFLIVVMLLILALVCHLNGGSVGIWRYGFSAKGCIMEAAVLGLALALVLFFRDIAKRK